MEKLALYGPLNVGDCQPFLENCKKEFFQYWEKDIPQTGSLEDFKILMHLGSGAFGKVYLVKHKNTGTNHAMKTIEKDMVVKYKQITHCKAEKQVLQCLNYPFTVHMDYFYKDNSFIYFIMPFIQGGEMFNHLQKLGRFDEQLARFYGAQVVLGLEYLHFLDIIYRDLKPENILVDHTGYLKIADFGFAKIVKTRTYTLCGTPEYIAPEIIQNKGYSKPVDWWSFGVLLYEMVAGRAPFYHRDAIKMYEIAAALKYFIPKSFSQELSDLIKNILQVDLTKRFGNLRNGVKDIKEHKWFRPIVWSNLLNRNMVPTYVPTRESIVEKTEINKIDLNISPKNLFEKEFKDF